MIRYKKYSKNKKGFTLIEIIVSIAIMGIISVAFLTMFTSGIIGISNSGEKSNSHYTAQSQMESNVNNLKNLSDDDFKISSTESIELFFSGSYYDISGCQIDVPYKYGSIPKKLTTFITK